MKISRDSITKSISILSASLLIGVTSVSAQTPGTNGRLIFANIGGTYNGGTEVGTGMFTIKNDGTGPHQFSMPFVNTGGDTSASYSPDGTKIAYAGEYVDGNTNIDILVRSADGTGTVTRVTSSSSGFDEHPRWSPDGTKIVFTRNVSGDREVITVNSDGTGSEEAITTNGAGGGEDPTYTPDGNSIVFVRGTGAIVSLDSTGTEQNATAITSGSATRQNPDVSPDGSTVVYSLSDTSTSQSIRTVAIGGGSDATLVTAASDNMYKGYPSYSPDGTKIAFIRSSSSSSPNAVDDIRVYTIAGGATTSIFSFDANSGAQSNGNLYSLTWGTNNATLTNNLGGDAFNTGLPDTGSKAPKPFNGLLPAILAAGAVLLLGAFGFVWYKREFGRKNR
ncbi:PD40 domain-containing protein [bacterium]|nr:PD40 domain-containing protein [bacterium]